MTNTIQITRSARTQIDALPASTKQRIASVIASLASNPRPPGTKKLVNQQNRWRVRAGDYRVVYEIQDRALIVLIVRVAHRAEVCRC